MRIVFYSTNSNQYDGEAFQIRTLPNRASVWDAVCARHADDEFLVATQLPASFLADVGENALAQKSARVQYHLLRGEKADDIAQEILALKPDLAIAATFWVTPFDWLGIQDGMVADLLRKNGVSVLCHPTALSLDCYDKWRTHILLERRGFAVPKALHVSYQQFWCERSHRDIKTNVYKDYLLRELEAMHYPVVIKDTVGLSSYGMEVATTYKQALHYLYSGRTNSDRIVESYLAGEQFGTEIYGANGNYMVMPPFAFSLNRYGITSPKQSVKLGPVTNAAYNLAELNELLLRLANELHFAGIAQVDLVFSGGIWYIIEINPRLSGMTETYAASLGTTVPELLLQIARGKPILTDTMQCACNFKLPLLTDAQMQEVAQIPSIAAIHQIHNTRAKQEREKGYCEIIVRGKTATDIIAELERLSARYPAIIEPIFLQNARDLCYTV